MANNTNTSLGHPPERHSVYFQRRVRDFGKGKLVTYAVRLAAFAVVLLIWELLARHYKSNLLLPSPWKVAVAFAGALHDEEVLSNLFLTLRRVITGFGLGLVIGGMLGLLMAKSKLVMQAIDPILNPLRQVPVMAWVPLSIIWFGLGEGPTLFLITLVSVFPIMLCTVSGIQGIDRDYYNAALSMGSSRVSLFYKITVPAAMPELLTGMRAGLSAGWMSVI